MKIISIANQKGGCGKTTTAINLVAALCVNGQRTLLIDLDPQAHATLGLNRDDRHSIYNIISRITPRKMTFKDIIQTVEKNFDIVPSNVLVGTLEQELAEEIGREMKLVEVIETVKDNYDYIIIDCPPSLGFLTVNALRASNEVVIPVETSRFSVQGVDHLMDIINLIRERLNHHIEPRVLVTMFDSRLRHSFSMLDKIRAKFSDMLLGTIVHTNVKLKESAVMGKPVLSYDKYCRGAKDYYSLAKELLSIDKKPVKEVALAATTEFTADEEIEIEAPELHDGGVEFSQRMKEIVAREVESISQVTFALNAPEAQSVYLAGSFNDWSLNPTSRMEQENGLWTLRQTLKPGVHQYQFVVDGRWQADPANELKESNGFGDMNSVIKVGANG
ncbi:MAG: AAA family ATPase [Candidatus Omnitrophica bacterium]|nr:AAA family ATPase [Candidatus Omnitrophota bacterium]